MSRSHHITKREAAKRLATEGDVGAVAKYAEKRNLKKVVKKFRWVYAVIHPSDKTPNKLRGSVAQRATKLVTKPKSEKVVSSMDGDDA